MEASILTLFVPAAILGFIDVFLFLRIFCLISSHTPPHLGPPTSSHHPLPPPHSNHQGGHNTIDTNGSPGQSEHDLDADDRNKELLPSNHNSSVNYPPTNHHLTNSFSPSSNQPLVSSYAEFVTSSNHSESPCAGVAPPPPSRRGAEGGGVILPDTAYRPMSHLLASVVILLLYCATWTAGALAIALPFNDDALPHADIVFQCLYSVLASALGAFFLVFFAVGRADLHLLTTRCSRGGGGGGARNGVPANASRGWKYVSANYTSSSENNGGQGKPFLPESSPTTPLETSSTPLTVIGQTTPLLHSDRLANGHQASSNGTKYSHLNGHQLLNNHHALPTGPAGTTTANRIIVPNVSTNSIIPSNQIEVVYHGLPSAGPHHATNGTRNSSVDHGTAADSISLTSRSVRSNGFNDSRSFVPSMSIGPSASVVVEPPHMLQGTSVGRRDTQQDYSAFFNPRQNGVAKKYWERSKRKRGGVGGGPGGGHLLPPGPNGRCSDRERIGGGGGSRDDCEIVLNERLIVDHNESDQLDVLERPLRQCTDRPQNEVVASINDCSSPSIIVESMNMNSTALPLESSARWTNNDSESRVRSPGEHIALINSEHSPNENTALIGERGTTECAELYRISDGLNGQVIPSADDDLLLQNSNNRNNTTTISDNGCRTEVEMNRQSHDRGRQSKPIERNKNDRSRVESNQGIADGGEHRGGAALNGRHTASYNEGTPNVWVRQGGANDEQDFAKVETSL